MLSRSTPGGMRSTSHALSHLILITTVRGSYLCFTDKKNGGPRLNNLPKSIQLLDGRTELWTRFMRPQRLNSSTAKSYQQTFSKELAEITETQDQEWRPRSQTGPTGKGKLKEDRQRYKWLSREETTNIESSLRTEWAARPGNDKSVLGNWDNGQETKAGTGLLECLRWRELGYQVRW